MNKKLLALAVAGAFAAPLAAQAEVSVYGLAHVSVDSLDDDGNTDGLFISSNTSRIGFKGSEDLGAGLKAIWQLEQSVNLDETGGGFASMNSFVGLAGNFGAVLAGRHDTPFKVISRKTDLFADQIGDSRNLVSMVSIDYAGWDLRPNNVIAYASPNMNGLQVLAAYVTEDGTDDAHAYSMNVTYGNGPLWAGIAYELHGKALTAGGDEETGIRLGASYSMGAIKVAGMYQTLSDLGGASGADADAWGLGVGFSFGNNVAKAQYYSVESDTTGDATMWAVGLDHNFSKTTTGYLAYASTDNDSGATYSVSGGGHGDNVNSVAGGNPTGFSLGMIHKF